MADWVRDVAVHYQLRLTSCAGSEIKLEWVVGRGWSVWLKQRGCAVGLIIRVPAGNRATNRDARAFPAVVREPAGAIRIGNDVTNRPSPYPFFQLHAGKEGGGWCNHRAHLHRAENCFPQGGDI